MQGRVFFFVLPPLMMRASFKKRRLLYYTEKAMKFSIIIPAHNSAAYIRKALASVRSQQFKDYELIVICDACTDNTEEIAREYGAIIEAVNFECDGPARSRGLDLASGEWILFMDDDDWWLHEFVLNLLAEQTSLAGADVLCFSFIFRGIGYATPTGNAGSLWPAVWNKCWRRSCIGDTRFPNIQAESDFAFHKAMMAKPIRIALWDMPLYYYNYMRPGSQTYGLRQPAMAKKESEDLTPG